MKTLEKVLNYSKSIGLVKNDKADFRFYVMLMQLDYILRNIPDLDADKAKTEVAKDLLKLIQANPKSYMQFSDRDNVKIAYYSLEVILGGNDEKLKEKLNEYISLYSFVPSSLESNRKAGYFEAITGLVSKLDNSKGTLFDTSGYASLDDEDVSTELNCSLDVKSFLDEMITSVVDDILKMQSSLYEAGYNGMTPDGVLWKVGELSAEPSVDKENGTRARYNFTQKTNPSLLKIYRFINNATGGQFDLSKYDGHMKVNIGNIQKGCYYYPHFQVRNSCGLLGLDVSLDKWLGKNKKSKIGSLKELSSYVTEEVTKGIKACLCANQDRLGLSKITDVTELMDNKGIEKIFNQFKRAFTTCALVSESKKDVVLKLRLCTGSDDIGSVLSKEVIESAIKSGESCNKYTKVSDWYLDSSGRILTVALLMDEKRYNSFPSFAANVLDSIKRNGGPSWSNVIIGKDQNDKMFTLNLTDNNTRVLAIIAGSRSGKGVLTMKIESDARALGIPVFYLDYKPDMSKTYYDIAQRFGHEAFAFDGLSLTAELGRDFNIMYNYDQIPKEIRDTIAGANFANPDAEAGSNSAIFDVKEFVYFTSYVRGVQLICKLIELRAKALNSKGSAVEFTIDQLGGERALVILDEVEKFCLYAESLMKKNGFLDNIRDRLVQNLVASGMPEKKAKEHKSLFWFTEYKNWVMNVFTSLETKDKAEIGLSNTNIIILAQSTNIDNTWGMIGQKLSTLVANGLKFCGNGSNIGGGSSKYGSGACPSEWRAQLPNRKFIIQKKAGGNVTEDCASLVKTYFLLNDVYNDDGSESKYVKDMFGSLGKDADSVRAEVTMEDGKLNPALGYLGYIKSLTGFTDEQLGQTFQNSFDIGEMIATKALGYNNLYECMYDLGSFTAGGKVYESYNEAENSNKNNSEESVPASTSTPSVDSILANLRSEDDEVIDIDLNQRTNHNSQQEVVRDVIDFDLNSAREESSNSGVDYSGYDVSSTGYGDTPVQETQVSQAINSQIDDLGFGESDGDEEIDDDSIVYGDEDDYYEEDTPEVVAPPTQTIRQPEPVQEPVPEPIRQTEPVRVPEPIQEPVRQQEPVRVPEPAPEPIRQPEPVPEPVRVPEPLPVNVNHPRETTAFTRDANGNVSVNKNNISNYSTLSTNNSIDCRSIQNARVFRNASKLARTARGAKTFKEDSCRYIFGLIDANIGLSNVTKVSLVNESITVNNKILDLNGIVGGDTGRKLSDLMSFKVFNNKFKSITYLEINGAFMDNYILEFNLPVDSTKLLEHIFDNFPLMSEVKIGNNVVTRTGFRLKNRKLDKEIKEERQKKSLDGLFARLSKNGSKETKNKAYEDSTSMSSYEKKSKTSRLGGVRDALGIGVYKIFGLVDYIANGR